MVLKSEITEIYTYFENMDRTTNIGKVTVKLLYYYKLLYIVPHLLNKITFIIPYFVMNGVLRKHGHYTI